MSEFGDLGSLFGAPKFPTAKKPRCAPDKHVFGSNDVCHRCGGKKKPKAKLRKKVVDGQAYIHAGDVADLLEANGIQAATVRVLRGLS